MTGNHWQLPSKNQQGAGPFSSSRRGPSDRCQARNVHNPFSSLQNQLHRGRGVVELAFRELWAGCQLVEWRSGAPVEELIRNSSKHPHPPPPNTTKVSTYGLSISQANGLCQPQWGYKLPAHAALYEGQHRRGIKMKRHHPSTQHCCLASYLSQVLMCFGCGSIRSDHMGDA